MAGNEALKPSAQAEAGRTPESPDTREEVINAFNSAFVRFKETIPPIRSKLYWAGGDRSVLSAKELEYLVGFNLISNGIGQVVKDRSVLSTNQLLSPSLDSYTFPVSFPSNHKKNDPNGLYIRLDEGIPVEPLMGFLTDEITTSQMVYDAPDSDKNRASEGLLRAQKEYKILVNNSKSWLELHKEKGEFYPSYFDGRRALEAKEISDDWLRRSNHYDDRRADKNWTMASVDLQRRRELVVPARKDTTVVKD